MLRLCSRFAMRSAALGVFATTATFASHRDAATERFNSYSLQHAVFDVQLPVASCCQTIVVCHDKERLLPIACQI
jgi:hypothetical protein